MKETKTKDEIKSLITNAKKTVVHSADCCANQKIIKDVLEQFEKDVTDLSKDKDIVFLIGVSIKPKAK